MFIIGCIFISPLAVSAETTKTSQIYNEWYVVRLNENDTIAYYNESLEFREGEYFTKQVVWRKDEGFINHEEIATQSKADFTPKFFNYKLKYRDSLITINGTVQESGIIRISSKKNDEPSNSFERSIPKNSIFSTVFPFWILKHFESNQNSKSVKIIFEDRLFEKLNFEAATVTSLKLDSDAKKLEAKKYLVKISGVSAAWYLGKLGMAKLISIPTKSMNIVLSTETEAKKLFDAK